MHKQWVDLIPYYVAGTVPRSKAAAFEQHLARCEACRRALDEWRTVAGTVRDEAQAWANQTPALSMSVRAQLGQPWGPSANGHSKRVPALDGTQTIRAVPRRADFRRPALPVTLAAAVLVAVLIGVLLLLRSTQSHEPDELGLATDVTPLAARTATPSPTRTLPPVGTLPGLTPAATSVADLGIIGPRPSSSPAHALASVTPQSPPPQGVCSVTSSTGNWVMVYSGPSFGYGEIDSMAPGEYRATWVQTNDGWYEVIVSSTGIATVGWVYRSDVKLNGPCGSLPEPSPTYVATPTARFDQAGGGYVLITTVQVGDIPAGTNVRIGGMWYDGSLWHYQIAAEGEQLFAEATEDQLAMAPDITPGPTPTSKFEGGYGYTLITLEQVGAIPANTRVGIGSYWFDGRKWRYNIVTMDGQLSAEAFDTQLAYLPEYTPGPTPTSQYNDWIGTGSYPLITLEQVGQIPAGTHVRIGSAWFDGLAWVYNIAAEGEQLFADARADQLTYAPGPTPTPTPTFSGPITINSFTASVQTFVAGQTFTLSWNVSGAASVKLVDYNATAPPYSETIVEGLAPVGSFNVTVPVPDAYAYNDTQWYQLVAVNITQTVEGSSTNGGLISGPLACPFSYFFGSVPDSCPERPTAEAGSATYQPFQNGFMVGLTRSGYAYVYVFFADGSWSRYDASGTQPDVIETPPDGLYQPFGALGQVWQTGVRDALGWGTTAAQSYTYSLQNEARPFLTTKTAINFYLSLADGRVLYLTPTTMGQNYGTWQGL